MFQDKADGTRLFARLRELDFECPRCGKVYVITKGKYPSGWDPRSAQFTCRECSITIQFGVLMYPVKPGTPSNQTIAIDALPTPRQAAALRQLQVGIHLDPTYAKRKNAQPRNIALRRVCQCQPADEAGENQVTHPGCPVHGGRAKEAPARAEAGTT